MNLLNDTLAEETYFLAAFSGEGHMAIEVRGMAPLRSVFDMPASIAFYCDGLGFKAGGTDGKPAPRFGCSS